MINLMATIEEAYLYENQHQLDQVIQSYQHALDIARQNCLTITSEYTDALLALARIYGDDHEIYSAVHDKSKSIEYYKLALESQNYYLIGPHKFFEPAAQLGRMYEEQGALERALEWYKRALEAFRSTGHVRDAYEDLVHAEQFLRKQPMYDFRAQLEKSISSEENTDPKTSPIIRDILRKWEFNKYAHDIGTIELMRHSYNKAIQDAYTAIAAYALAKDQQIDKTMIDMTFYYHIVFWGNDILYRDRLKGMSPICKSILTTNIGYHADDDLISMYHIWYMGHFIKGIEAAFKSLKKNEKWESYIDKARQIYMPSDDLNDLPEYCNYKLYEVLQPFNMPDVPSSKEHV